MENDLEPILREIGVRFKRVRSALAVGFKYSGSVAMLRERVGGLWMEAAQSEELDFDDSQFDIVVVARTAVSREVVREANRVLRSDGFMFFTVPERSGGAEGGFTAPEVYRLVREGFDILSVVRPKWWYFGLRGHTLTVTARKKAWREHKGLRGSGGTFFFKPFNHKER